MTLGLAAHSGDFSLCNIRQNFRLIDFDRPVVKLSFLTPRSATFPNYQRVSPADVDFCVQVSGTVCGLLWYRVDRLHLVPTSRFKGVRVSVDDRL